MNVLFPFKNLSRKSMYVSQVKVPNARDIDDVLERQMEITLQGNVSYCDCVKAVATVGNNLYAMSTNLDIGIEGSVNNSVFGNGLTVVNGYGVPYYFPHSLTFFQPSQDQYDGINLSKDSNGLTDFIRWYKLRNHKTRITLNDTYGTNISRLECLGSGSYNLDLATYSPTDLIMMKKRAASSEDVWLGLNTKVFRKARAGLLDWVEYVDGKIVVDNEKVNSSKPIVGMMFNLYDTFITEKDRILRVKIPKDDDFNKL